MKHAKWKKIQKLVLAKTNTDKAFNYMEALGLMSLSVNFVYLMLTRYYETMIIL